MSNETKLLIAPLKRAAAKLAMLFTLVAILAAPFSALSVARASNEQMDDPVYNTVKSTGVGLLTPWESEAKNAIKRYGYSSYSELFKASTAHIEGTHPVYRLYNNHSGDFFVTIWPSERDTAVKKYGYTYNHVSFYAERTKQADNVAVHRYLKGAIHRYAVTEAERSSLKNNGFRYEGTAFYAAPADKSVTAESPIAAPEPTTPSGSAPSTPTEPVTTPSTPPTQTPTSPEPTTDQDSDGKFTIAIMPDTQLEAFGNDTRFQQRTQWLASNKNNLDLRFVGHTGDVVNWGWTDKPQFAIASKAAENLERANIPYALAIGNHDTRAVGHDGKPGSRGYGGSAYVNNPECIERLGASQCKTGLLQHDTREFNAVFNKGRYGAVNGEFQRGKVDNIYSTFSAAGKNWMMLTLEMNPRAEVVAWAKNVVANHPRHNVLIQTHQYLNSDGSISGSNGYGDGSLSAKYLYDNLIKRYPNIVATFSGHTGSHTVRAYTGINGNKIISYLQTFHSRTTNPVRMLEFDVKSKSITTWVYAPYTNQTMVAKSIQSNLSFVSK